MYTNEIIEQIALALPDDGGVLGLMRATVTGCHGKLIRGGMCVEFARNFALNKASVAVLAAAIELIHGASLLQDDIFDNDDIRRNAPAFHVKWGKSSSILYSDIMVSKAYRMILSLNRTDIANILVDAVSDMCKGEIQHKYKNIEGITADEYIDIVSKKTAALFRASCQSGAMIATDNKELIGLASEYGHCYGIAFQLVDDCVDLEAVDSKNHILTMPRILDDHTCEKTAGMAIDYIRSAENCVMRLGRIKDFGSTIELSRALKSLEAQAVSIINIQRECKV